MSNVWLNKTRNISKYHVLCILILEHEKNILTDILSFFNKKEDIVAWDNNIKTLLPDTL